MECAYNIQIPYSPHAGKQIKNQTPNKKKLEISGQHNLGDGCMSASQIRWQRNETRGITLLTKGLLIRS